MIYVVIALLSVILASMLIATPILWQATAEREPEPFGPEKDIIGRRLRPSLAEIEADLLRDPVEWIAEAESEAEREALSA